MAPQRSGSVKLSVTDHAGARGMWTGALREQRRGCGVAGEGEEGTRDVMLSCGNAVWAFPEPTRARASARARQQVNEVHVENARGTNCTPLRAISLSLLTSAFYFFSFSIALVLLLLI